MCSGDGFTSYEVLCGKMTFLTQTARTMYIEYTPVWSHWRSSFVFNMQANKYQLTHAHSNKHTHNDTLVHVWTNTSDLSLATQNTSFLFVWPWNFLDTSQFSHCFHHFIGLLDLFIGAMIVATISINVLQLTCCWRLLRMLVKKDRAASFVKKRMVCVLGLENAYVSLWLTIIRRIYLKWQCW